MGRPRSLIIVVVCAAMAGCGGGQTTRSPAKTPAPEASAAPTPAPLMFGTHRYISPCSVLPMDAAQRIYGALKPGGYVRQEYYDQSLTPAEFKAKTDNVTRSVRTVCHYNRGDAQRTSVQVTVEQYRSDKIARSEWASIAYLGTGKESRKLAKRDFSGPSWDFNWIAKLARENERDMGGKRVKGIDDVLFVRGRADFVAFRHNALIRLSYLPLSFVTPVFSARQYRKQAAKARRAFRVIFKQLDRPDLAQQPVGPAINGERAVNGMPYLDPCRVLSARVFELATGHAPTENAESESLPLRSAGSPEASCSRTARHKKRRRALTARYDNADLSVRVATKPQSQQTVNVGTELAGDWIIDRYVNRDARGRVTVQALMNAGVVTQVSDDDTEADALYVFDSTRKTGRKKAFRRAFFNVGPYAFMLGVKRNSGLELYSGKQLGAAGYRKVVDAIAADVRAGLKRPS